MEIQSSFNDTRIELHKKFFVEVEIYSEVKEIIAECNITYFLQYFLKDNPSAIEEIECKKCGISTCLSRIILLPPTSDIQFLQEDIIDYVMLKGVTVKFVNE